ncbi:hypothetical protein AUR64_01590 [Haloprofundus marisrubri]|uniref:SHOCT domain-containing protein n=1 Tax=Haloprofundus marisrubri TaxID=1514971 RepID=A0A0W1R498_9EURY|nr:SHOCT domain-containing protein [Haloprofundus marisrubri]KTG07954.1 hypothetical protein AUR64_01590 [Haloprofundus marisrubri]
MNPPSDASTALQLLARYTPDTRRWRRVVGGVAAIGGVLAVWALFAVASGVKTGAVYYWFMFLFSILALTLPAFGTAALLAPDSGLTRTTATEDDDATETLKQRYAAGDISREEFERRLDGLIENTDTELTQHPRPGVHSQMEREPTLDSANTQK